MRDNTKCMPSTDELRFGTVFSLIDLTKDFTYRYRQIFSFFWGQIIENKAYFLWVKCIRTCH